MLAAERPSLIFGCGDSRAGQVALCGLPSASGLSEGSGQTIFLAEARVRGFDAVTVWSGRSVELFGVRWHFLRNPLAELVVFEREAVAVGLIVEPQLQKDVIHNRFAHAVGPPQLIVMRQRQSVPAFKGSLLHPEH